MTTLDEFHTITRSIAGCADSRDVRPRGRRIHPWSKDDSVPREDTHDHANISTHSL